MISLKGLIHKEVFVMISTYNYLASSYFNRPVAKNNNTHNKKELKNIYNNIVKMNRESPLYMFNLSDDNQNFALNIKDAAYSLSSTLDDFTSSSHLFDHNSFSSSDNSVASVSVFDKSAASDLDDFLISVHELATSQTNTGRSMYPGKSGLTPGTYKFDISVYDDTYSFQFPVSAGMSNEDIQSALADFITKANIGLTVTTQYDKNESKNHMVMNTNFTGCNFDGSPAVSITDTSMVNGRGIIEYFDLDNITSVGRNSSFNINGVDKTTHGNSFTYNNAMTISLNGTSDEPIPVTRSSDADTIVNSLDKLCSSYNSLIDTALHNVNASNKSTRLLNTLTASTLSMKNSMESCGLTIDATGHMVVDKSLAYQAADSGDLEKMLLTPSGLISGLKSKAGSININPMEFVQKTIVTYPNVSKPGVSNPYVSSIYSGMLFNYYC